MLVHVGDGGRTLAHGAGHPLDRASADVARGEDTGHARLQRLGPTTVEVAAQVVEVVAGDDEAGRVDLDLRRQPVGVRSTADEDEEGVGLDHLDRVVQAVSQRYPDAVGRTRSVVAAAERRLLLDAARSAGGDPRQ